MQLIEPQNARQFSAGTSVGSRFFVAHKTIHQNYLYRYLHFYDRLCPINAYANSIDERSESCVIASKQPHNNALATSFRTTVQYTKKTDPKKENGTHVKSKKKEKKKTESTGTFNQNIFSHKLNLQVNTAGWEAGRRRRTGGREGRGGCLCWRERRPCFAAIASRAAPSFVPG